MQLENFCLACDQLSQAVDATQFERLRWARDEGPKLARLVELAQGAVAQRDDFELTDEGSGGAIRRFVVKVHGFRIMAVEICLENNIVSLQAEAIERSRFAVRLAEPVKSPFAQVDEAWMAATLGQLFSRVQS